jgi:hypothetical protein
MSELEFRPRFRFSTPLPASEVNDRLARHASGDPRALVLGGTGQHISLSFPHQQQQAWTPQMDIDIETLDGRTMVRCLIGPAPSIWMLFVGGYMLCVVLALLGISIGVSQQVVGAEPWGFLMVVPTPFLAVALWGMAQVGKRKARADMRYLKNFVDTALGCDCFALSEQG